MCIRDSIEDAPHLERMLGQIAAIESYTFDFNTVARQRWREPDNFLCSSFRIVGIDEQDHVLWQCTCKVVEGHGLIVMGLNERVGHCAVYGNAKKRRRQY